MNFDYGTYELKFMASIGARLQRALARASYASNCKEKNLNQRLLRVLNHARKLKWIA
jgi:hypothetical protein